MVNDRKDSKFPRVTYAAKAESYCIVQRTQLELNREVSALVRGGLNRANS